MQELERTVAKLYVFCLPIRMITPLTFLQKYVGGCALNFDFVFHTLGLLLWFANGGKIIVKKETKQLWTFFIFIVASYTILNIWNATVYHDMLGVAFGEDTYRATIGSILYWIHYALIITYNLRVFQLLGTNKIWKLLDKLSFVMAIIGYCQIFVIVTRNTMICKIYDLLASDILFLPSSYLLKENRITLTTTEPAHAGYIIARLILPLLLMYVITEGLDVAVFIKLAIWLPIIYFTRSSNAYILVGVELVAFIIVAIGKLLKIRRVSLSRHSASILVIMVFACGGIPFILDKIDLSQLIYLVFQKITDKTNMSTAWRVAPLYINWRIFTDFPLLGIGNGNQGFLYWKYFPDWAYTLLAGTKTMEWNSDELPNGLLFFPSVLSGYGIIGTMLLIMFLALTVIYIWKKRDNKREFIFFAIAMCGILANGFSSDFVGCYDVWFVMSIPFLCSMIEKEEIYKNERIMYSSGQ